MGRCSELSARHYGAQSSERGSNAVFQQHHNHLFSPHFLLAVRAAVQWPVLTLCHGHRIKQSQSCGGWKGPVQLLHCNPPSPSSSLQQLHTQHPGRFGSLHRRRLPHLSGQLCQGSATLTAHSSSSRSHRTPWAPICARCPLSWRWAPPNTARPPPPHPQPFTYPPALLRPPSAFSPPRAQPRGSQPVPIRRCSRPPPSLHPQLGSLFPVCLQVGSPTLGTVLQLCPPVQSRGQEHLPPLLATLCAVHPRVPLASWATSRPGAFFADLLSSSSAPLFGNLCAFLGMCTCPVPAQLPRSAPSFLPLGEAGGMDGDTWTPLPGQPGWPGLMSGYIREVYETLSQYRKL